MRDIVKEYQEKFRRNHQRARRYTALLLALALTTGLFVNWQLHGVGIAKTAEYLCGELEHEHTAACYEKQLVCGYEEGEPEDWNATMTDDSMSFDDTFGMDADDPGIAAHSAEPEYIFVPHEHTDDCYQEVQELTCREEEHEHTDDCFDPEDGSLICELFEHTHDDSCYTTEYELVCGLDEGELVEEPNPAYQEMPASRPVVDLPPEPAETTPEEPVLHHHTDACYTEELVCTIPEHHHTVECLADTQADVETAEEWQAAANVALNGNWAEDLLTVAKSQLDYQQSDKNFKLDVEDQQVLRGYSRYGAWYGNPYGAWDVMFLSYCLHFAGVPQTVVPQRAGVMALHSDLRGSQWLTDADGSTARPGDIVIYNTLTTEQVAVDESSYGIALLDLDEDPDTAAQLTASEPQVDTRTVTTETVGVVSAVDPDAGTLTVISGNVDGKVAEVPAAMSDVTSVISVTGAYAAETTAVAPEDPAGSQEELDGSYALLEDEDGFGATVEWVGEARQQDPDAPALLAETADTEVNLDPAWITKIAFEQKVNGSWETLMGNEVESGTNVQVTMTYKLPAGTLTPDRRTLCYQLPDAMKPKQPTSGEIKDETDNNKVIGTYTIDTDGLAKLTFDKSDKFTGLDAKGNREFTGTFKFSRKVWADDFENNKTITFEKGYTLTIKKKTADIKISKGYTGYWSAFENHPESGTFINHYKVTVETTSGTKEQVFLTDTLNTNRNGENRSDYLKGGQYLESSFKLYKVDASGTKTMIKPVPVYQRTTDSHGYPQVVLGPLDPLEIGEKYIWYYDVQRNYADFDQMPNGVGIINNTAKAEAGNVVDQADAWYTCKNPRIEKKGQYDPKTGHIQWTITVKVPHSFLGSYMLQGCKITDDLPDSVKIVGDVKVGNDTIPAEDFLQKGYTIPADFTGTELTITFETTTPLGGGTVTNTAKVETKSDHTFEASATVNIGQGAWTLSKELSSSSKGLAKWNISAANAAGESSFTLVETLRDAVNESGQTQLDTHYAYAAELEEALEKGLTLTLHDGGTMNYADAKAAGVITVTYYSGVNGTGGTVTANDPSTWVRSFTIQINKADDNPVRRVEVKDLPTHENQSNVPTGEKWTYKNSVSIQGSSQRAEAEDTYHSYKSFEKRVSANSDQDESGYQSGDQTYQYSKLDGNNLHYQLVVQTAAEDDADIVITDTLPENTKFKTDWVTIGMDKGALDKADKLEGAAATVAYEEATRKLTITISRYNLNKPEQHKFRILYKVSVDDDPRWKNPSVGQVIYTNTAQWGELTETLHTTVEKTVDPLKKTGQLVEVDGKTDRIEYQVVVNPARKDLSVGATEAPTIELWDDVKAQNGAIVRGDPESVKLYYFQYDDATNAVTRGDEVPRNLYQVLPADDEGWLHMVIPNQTALILVYQCDVKQGSAAEDYNVDNTVKLGNGDSTESDSIKFTYASAATASTGQFLLHKVDDYSGVALQGAEFTIWQYDLQIKDWQPWSGGVNGVITTDEKGQVSLTVLENGGPQTLKPDVLYKIVETKAPQNYQGDDTPHYVLFHKSSETPRTAFDTATGKGTAMDGEKIIQFEDVQVGSAAQTTTAQYTNRYSNLTVSKLWLDQDTKKPVDPAAESIDIEVWRYTDSVESEEWFGKATLNKDNGWTFTWSGTDLPLTDEKGNAYHYLVKETTTGNWNVYISNNGVQTGNITVQNYVYTGYELPSTGGMGTAPFGMLGGALAAAAALLLVRKRKQNEEE